ncbi:signal peptidase II [Peredibacter sp. HCB2-198]|uniref:signal peptidase II n=1 Tax=Peredibacter sp. HCB2-198 TaxID=3383025 RepID=UPI0038B47377
MARFWALCLLMATLIIVDQLTKGAIQTNLFYGQSIPVIDGLFSIAYVKNTGAAFGFGAGGPEWFRQVFFLALPVIFCGWIFYLMIKTIKGAFFISLAYALIIAGAVGNLIDRFSLGYVVDFLLFYWKEEANHFPAFNVADSCITIAAGLLIIDFFLQLKAKKAGESNASNSVSKL